MVQNSTRSNGRIKNSTFLPLLVRVLVSIAIKWLFQMLLLFPQKKKKNVVTFWSTIQSRCIYFYPFLTCELGPDKTWYWHSCWLWPNFSTLYYFCLKHIANPKWLALSAIAIKCSLQGPPMSRKHQPFYPIKANLTITSLVETLGFKASW